MNLTWYPQLTKKTLHISCNSCPIDYPSIVKIRQYVVTVIVKCDKLRVIIATVRFVRI
jgi:hypothetical protein